MVMMSRLSRYLVFMLLVAATDQGDVHIVADDGISHRAEWRTGDAPRQGLPWLVKELLLVLGLLGVAAFFNRQAKKKQAAVD